MMQAAPTKPTDKPTDKANEFTRTSRHISLHRFMRQAWSAVEGANYKDNWHTAAVAEHLEAVSFGQIKRLLIIVPPQTTKSVLAGTYWPAWEWTFAPQTRWLYTSNSAQLAEVESLRCRKLIESPWYRSEFGIPWHLRSDKNTQSYYVNTADGSRQAVGYNANFTGLKAHRIIVDDPNDADKVHSETERRRVNRKFDNAISDRLIDLENDPIVIIGQRVHVNDLIGHVKEQGGWTELHIRELFETKKRTTYAVPFTYRGKKYRTDPRTKDGQMLRPKGLGKRSIQQRKRTNPRNFSAKHQGDPRTEEGARFKLSWFNNRWRFADDLQHIELVSGDDVYRVLPLGALNVRERFGICDPAASKKSSADYTVISTFLITQRYDLVFLGMARDRWELPEQPKRLADEYQRWKMQWVGVEAVFSNRFLEQAGQRSFMSVRTLDPGGRDKLAHSVTAQVYAEAGRLWLPEPSAAKIIGFPLHDAIDEITSFTGNEQEDEHDDVIDTISYAADHMSRGDTGGQAGAAPSFIGPTATNAWQFAPASKPTTAAPTMHPPSQPTGGAWRRPKN